VLVLCIPVDAEHEHPPVPPGGRGPICHSAHVHGNGDHGAGAGTRRPGARPGRAAWVLAGAVVVLVTVLAVLGARSGPWVPTSPSSPSAASTVAGAPVLPQQKLPPRATATTPPTPFWGGADGGVVVWVLAGVLLLLLLAGLALLAAGLLHRPMWRTRAGRSEGDPLEAADRPAVLPGAVERALDAVEDPYAREAVVQAWLLLCRAAAQSGTAPRPAETAAEYAGRLAAERGLPAGAVTALAELYREARFSDHEVRPEQRQDAREHLLALRAALAERPGPRPATGRTR
jgi:Domain of unknown function (DUF4129)